ncbi:VWA domain-containing protein [Pseudozobellia sp. WGM2]|uniref:vWA domain-containing protein n=1 Tax=Pseudozobellia sp. WGM2 TaxID=2787625 RepID=UPI001ADF53C5|nr:VWA domain-containing protein [Pseudozobellia sp. WGM2]
MRKLAGYLVVFLLVIGCEEDSEGDVLLDSTFSENFAPSPSFKELPQVEKYTEYGENAFINTSDESVSTFSVDADGASYSNTRRFLELGQNPPPAAVRIEEFLNYFTFDYEEPLGEETVSINGEIADCPWADDHYLMRLGMKGKTIAASEIPDANYVFLIDVSGSMSSPEKLELLKTGFKLMVDEMRDTDKMAIVTYAGEAGVLLESTFGDEKDQIKAAIDQLGAGGSTAGAEGILTAYEIAEKNFIPQGNNRIILGSDGDFNVGPSSTEELVELIEDKRDNGVYLTVLGVGTGNLNDASMEQIANKGNGNYEYIDNIAQLKKVFIHERGKFYAVAKDSKIQVTFNADVVQSYRLIGYENRSLNEDDFEDDTVDAGEIGSAQTITALYEIVLTENTPNGPLGTFDFRYKKPDTEESRPLSLDIANTPSSIESSSENMRFAAGVTAFGLLMKQSEFSGTASKEMILDLTENAIGTDEFGYRTEFRTLVTNSN